MEVITKIKEVAVVPNNGGMSIEVRKHDVIVNNGNVIGDGIKGEYVDAFDLLPTQVDAIMQFMTTSLGKAVPKASEIVAVNVQVMDEDMFVSIATTQPIMDADGNKIGQTPVHRSVVELTAKQLKMIGDFVGNQLNVLQADVQAYNEALIEEQTKQMNAEIVEG